MTEENQSMDGVQAAANGPGPVVMTLEEAEREAILAAARYLYFRNELGIVNLSRVLGISRHSMRRRINKFETDFTDPRAIGVTTPQLM